MSLYVPYKFVQKTLCVYLTYPSLIMLTLWVLSTSKFNRSKRIQYQYLAFIRGIDVWHWHWKIDFCWFPASNFVSFSFSSGGVKSLTLGAQSVIKVQILVCKIYILLPHGQNNGCANTHSAHPLSSPLYCKELTDVNLLP